jgi:hypothetical protein
MNNKIPFKKLQEVEIELSDKDKEFLLQQVMNPPSPTNKLIKAIDKYKNSFTYTKEK